MKPEKDLTKQINQELRENLSNITPRRFILNLYRQCNSIYYNNFVSELLNPRNFSNKFYNFKNNPESLLEINIISIKN